MNKLLFATGNQAKLRQLAYVLGVMHAPLRLVAARDRFGDGARYDENGGSAEGIARHGAEMLARRLGVPVAVEDTTFHLAALGGEPGTGAGAYLKAHGRAGILAALDGQSDRGAVIVSAVAWAAPGAAAQTWVHSVHGRVSHAERWLDGLPDWIAPTGANPSGGGYNAIFIPDGENRTLAEIPADEALDLGYRELNFRALIDFVAARSESMGENK